MAGGKVYGSSNMSNLLQNEKLPSSSSDFPESLWIPSSSPTFHGSSSMVSFENVCDKSPFFGKEEPCDDDYDGCFLQPGKKRRLSVYQVQFLERNFEVENKLEPERKVQLAKELGLQPRQVAIWFQNRRARYKTKQLEKDYDVLKSSFDKLQSEYDILLKEKDKLKEEVMLLKDKLLIRDNGSVQILENQEQQEHVPMSVPENGSDSAPPMLVCKQEDASSAKSDVLDSDSPHYATQLEPTTADSSNVFESDFSQDEDDDNFTRSFLPAPSLPAYLASSSCNFGFPVEDQLFCFWP